MDSKLITEIAETCRTPMISVVDLAHLLHLLVEVNDAGVPGEVIEMGCNRGGTSLALAKTLAALGSTKRLHVVDSFKGFPEPSVMDGPRRRPAGDFCVSEDELLRRFNDAQMPPPVVHPGFFADIRDYPEQLAFAFIDADLFHSTIDALNIVWPRLSRGGIIVLHDYTSATYPGVRKATEMLLADAASQATVFGGLGILHKEFAP